MTACISNHHHCCCPHHVFTTLLYANSIQHANSFISGVSLHLDSQLGSRVWIPVCRFELHSIWYSHLASNSDSLPGFPSTQVVWRLDFPAMQNLWKVT